MQATSTFQANKGFAVRCFAGSTWPASLKYYCVFEGNVLFNMLIFENITAYKPRILSTLYEHEIFVQDVASDINSFDARGLELSKFLAEQVFNDLHPPNSGHKYEGPA